MCAVVVAVQAQEVEIILGGHELSDSVNSGVAAATPTNAAKKSKLEDLRKGFATLRQNIILLEQFRACCGCSLIGIHPPHIANISHVLSLFSIFLLLPCERLPMLF